MVGLGLRLGFSSSTTTSVGPPKFDRRSLKQHLDLVQRAAIRPNVIKCCSNFSSDDFILKILDLRLRKIVKEEIKSCCVQKPQVPKDFPFEVVEEDNPRRPLRLKRRDEGVIVDVEAYLVEDILNEEQKGWFVRQPPPLLSIHLEANILKEERLLNLFWWADPDPHLCVPNTVIDNGVYVYVLGADCKPFDWKGTLEAIGVDDSIVTQFAIDCSKFRCGSKRWLALKKFDDFIKFRFKDKVLATPWGDVFGPESDKVLATPWGEDFGPESSTVWSDSSRC